MGFQALLCVNRQRRGGFGTMAKNSNLAAAKKAKKDEFYTQITDIEKELVHYKDQLRGKIIFCNCDDPEWSNFWRYFDLNFDNIGIKALIATHYDPEKPTYKLEIRRDADGNKLPAVKTDLKQNGDFRSPECVELLKDCEVVVSNPPFSIFREYVAQLMRYKKQFIIVGNQNAITYKEFFPLLRDNKVWIGQSIHGGDREFEIPDSYEVRTKSLRVENGRRFICVPGVRWYTNLDVPYRHEPLILFRRYKDDPSKYPKYDNYDAINVDKTADIPEDYMGVMGVPITFLDKYCPEQFEIIDINPHFFTLTVQGIEKPKQLTLHNVNKKDPYARILIRAKSRDRK